MTALPLPAISQQQQKEYYEMDLVYDVRRLSIRLRRKHSNLGLLTPGRDMSAPPEKRVHIL